ncbi:protein SAAL1 isoform X2 [Dromiciops gliroides]|uniref:protein SAAL1 isoform X2 n=1 Tax=Dromiciops gliroides TaxID=33562 RepID=UPI001CC408EA|nr:protein SAAL1 isoform X2 [Dromiciops gliroides]
MDRNPSPPWRGLEAEAEAEAAAAAGDSIGATMYSKHWLFGVLGSLIQLINPEKDKSRANNEEEQLTELDEEMEDEICRVWDMSMDEDVALFLHEFNAPDIFMGVLAKSKCPRLMEICVGILGNMACFQEICVSISNDKNIGQTLLHCLFDLDPPTLLEISRLLLTCLSQPQVANIWIERIQENPAVYDRICFIMSSSTNVDLLVKVGEVVDKLFDLDEKLMVEWVRNGSAQALDPSSGDSVEQPPLKIVPCVLEAAKQIRFDNPVGLDVYMHILQLLTTVDDGIQAIVQPPDIGRDTWNFLSDLACHDFCQPDDPPVILQEQKTVLASVFSVLSAVYASQAEQDYIKMEKNLPLIGGLIRVLHNMEDCQKKSVNLADSSTEETEKPDISKEDFHLQVLKDVSCELLSNIFQQLTKENIIQALKEDHLNKEKCFCAFKNLLPLYHSVVKGFLHILCEADKALGEDLVKDFPSLKAQN